MYGVADFAKGMGGYSANDGSCEKHAKTCASMEVKSES